MAKEKDYYFSKDELKQFGNITEFQQEMGRDFFNWYGNVMAEGALTSREKALIALAVAHAIQCPYCIDAYSDGCLQHGAAEEEMMEAVHVAAAIKAGTTLVYGVQMMNHVKGKMM
ncbi:MAG TPA: 4-carboxymuconolactone decarboxylase [Bacteroidetes bacterium]|nr:4-carboxymuconolactone decarboxylase [Bacteroidota bacterium]